MLHHLRTSLRVSVLACGATAPLLAQANIATFIDPGHRPRDTALDTAGTRAVIVDDTGNVRVYDVQGAVELAPANPIQVGPTTAPGLIPARNVVCTPSRAVVVGFDLTTPGAAKTNIAVIDISGTPTLLGSMYQSSSGAAHDIALAPDGQFAAVNGDGHIWFVRLASAHVRDVPTIGGLYPPFALVPLPRSIVATNTRVVAIRNTGPQGVVHVYDPTAFVADPEGDPVGGIHALSLEGAPFDLDLSPNLMRAMVVTTGHEQFLFDLTVPVGMLQDQLRIALGTCVMDGYRIQDSIELTNEVALVSRINGGTTGRVELFDVNDPALISVPSASFDLDGWPHDVDASPSGSVAVVTTHQRNPSSSSGVLALDLPSAVGASFAFALPSGGFLSELPFDYVRQVSESVRVTNERALVITNDAESNPTTGHLRVLDLRAAPAYAVIAEHSLPAAGGGGPVFDLELSADDKRAAVVVDGGDGTFLSLATGSAIGNLPGVGDLRSTPIANALVMSTTRALTAGVDLPSNTARTRIFDTCSALPMPLTVCPATPNSTGAIATLAAFGSTSIVANDLVLVISSLPPGTTAILYFGPRLRTPPAPISTGGTNCIAGPIERFATTSAGPDGVVTQAIDFGAAPMAGVVQAGETWWFQLYYRNVTQATTSNTSDVLQITFCP